MERWTSGSADGFEEVVLGHVSLVLDSASEAAANALPAVLLQSNFMFLVIIATYAYAVMFDVT